jgi:hypothetical protein
MLVLRHRYSLCFLYSFAIPNKLLLTAHLFDGECNSIRHDGSFSCQIDKPLKKNSRVPLRGFKQQACKQAKEENN